MDVKTSIIVVEECGLSSSHVFLQPNHIVVGCIMYARERQDEYIVNTLTQRKESSKKNGDIKQYTVN